MQSTITISDAQALRWDVIIVGAGPAGGFSAIRLANEGLRVLLIDKEFHPRPKVCGACINPMGVSLLAREGLLSGLSSAVELKRAAIFSRGKEFSFPLHGGIAIDRAVLDSYLIQAAMNKGAAVLFGWSAKISDSSADAGHVVLSAHGEAAVKLSARVVVGAFGLSGLRALKHNHTLAESEIESHLGAGAIAPHVTGVPKSTIFMAIGARGYVGGVLLSDGSLDTAAALSPTFVRSCGGIKQAVSSILAEAGVSDILRSDLSWNGTPLLSRTGTISAPRYFAVGDACGYVEPFTGEGITWALQSADLAAPIIARAARDWSEDCTAEWNALYEKTIKRRKRLCKGIQLILRMPPWIREVALRGAGVRPVMRIVGRVVGGEAFSWV